MTTDPIADMLTRLRNAAKAGIETVEAPSSKLKTQLAHILRREGFLADVAEEAEGVRRTLKMRLKYAADKSPVLRGVRRVSRPGCRRYSASDAMPRVRSGTGMAIITTSRGLMTDREARQKKLGGEVICHVW